METLTTVLASSAAPMSLQDSGKAMFLQDSGEAISFQDSGIEVMSPQDCDAFDYDDFVDSDHKGLLEEDLSPRHCDAFDYGDCVDSDDEGSLEEDLPPPNFDHGDFVDTDDEGLLEEHTEPAERYDLGLYYPICIGDVLVQTYRIEHKLGHGGYSTAWLAHDIQKQKDVALKIMIHGNPGEDEYNMQQEIIRTVQDTSNLLTCLTTFSLTGPNGDHRVLVFPVWGPSLCSCLREMSIATRREAGVKGLGMPTQRRNCAPG
jgi:hypothetical protein